MKHPILYNVCLDIWPGTYKSKEEVDLSAQELTLLTGRAHLISDTLTEGRGVITRKGCSACAHRKQRTSNVSLIPARGKGYPASNVVAC